MAIKTASEMWEKKRKMRIILTGGGLEVGEDLLFKDVLVVNVDRA